MITEHCEPKETFRKVMSQLIGRWDLDVKPSVSRLHQQHFLHYDVANLNEIIDEDGNIAFVLRVTKLLPTLPRGSKVKIQGFSCELKIRNVEGRMLLVDPTDCDSLVDVEDEQSLNEVFDRLKPQPMI